MTLTTITHGCNNCGCLHIANRTDDIAYNLVLLITSKAEVKNNAKAISWPSTRISSSALHLWKQYNILMSLFQSRNRRIKQTINFSCC